MHKVVQATWELLMKIKMICIAAVLSVAAISQASAGGILSGGKKSGIGNGSIVIAPNVGVLNGSNTSILSGILSGNSILSGSNLLSGNGGLLGLGILSGNNNDNSRNKNRR